MDYGFCDLCVNLPENKEKLKEILYKLQNVGYNTIAINQNVDEAVFDNQKKKKFKNDDGTSGACSVPEPFNLNDLKEEFEGKLNILNRITFSFSDPIKTHSLNQLPVLKKYGLYAVVPKTQTAFQYACSQLNADIISINSTSTGLKLSRKLYLQAIDRQTYFEIQYSDLIQVSTRKLAIHFSHLFYTFGKSKNVIMSSGASNIFSIRNPYDVINLARILGLNEVKAKFSILQETHHVILKGDGRNSGKAFFKIQNELHVTDDLDNLCDIKFKKN